ncbi:MAG TPA: UDP-2,3-diacylglucosamine diphosphatase [Gammaproteobacteria bacterium]|nr:UDP-2,3-diacylglucosamine diphosphatase [Gammaproteobacteria bacterium]
MATLFISDLHLSGERPAIARLFLDFLHGQARAAEALYILGDLFEAWIGDDAIGPEHGPVLDALRALVDSGVPVYVMHGNRDFLLGSRFEQMSGSRLLNDPSVIDLYGTPTLLMHGDTLCTDDKAYQEFRRMVRDPQWQAALMAKTPAERIALAREYREMSASETAQKAEAIMDVNQAAVENALREHGVSRLIHGHTHRPAIHEFDLDGRPVRRIVLGDWYEQGSVLTCTAEGCELASL